MRVPRSTSNGLATAFLNCLRQPNGLQVLSLYLTPDDWNHPDDRNRPTNAFEWVSLVVKGLAKNQSTKQFTLGMESVNRVDRLNESVNRILFRGLQCGSCELEEFSFWCHYRVSGTSTTLLYEFKWSIEFSKSAFSRRDWTFLIDLLSKIIWDVFIFVRVWSQTWRESRWTLHQVDD